MADAWTGLGAIAGFDAADPYSAAAAAAALAAPTACGPGRVPDAASRQFFGDSSGGGGLRRGAAERSAQRAWELVELDFAPLFAVAALLYEGAWVAERQAAIADFLETAPPTRCIR